MNAIEKAADSIIRELAGRDMMGPHSVEFVVLASEKCLEPLREALRARSDDRPKGWNRWAPDSFVMRKGMICGQELDIFWVVTTTEEMDEMIHKDIYEVWLACCSSRRDAGNMNVIVVPSVDY